MVTIRSQEASIPALGATVATGGILRQTMPTQIVPPVPFSDTHEKGG